MDSSHSPSLKMANETSHNAEVVSLPTDDSRASKRVRRILFAPLPIAGGDSQEDEPRKKGVIRKETEEDATVPADDETWIRNYSLMVALLQRDRIFGRFQEQKKELTAHGRQITELNDKMKEIIGELEIERINRMCFSDEFDDLEGEMEALKAEMEEWIGRTLKLEFLFKQMKRVGLESSEDIFDTFQDIEVPEVSIKIKKKYVPTVETDAIDYTDYEQDREFYGDAIGPEIGADDYNYASEDEEEEEEEGQENETIGVPSGSSRLVRFGAQIADRILVGRRRMRRADLRTLATRLGEDVPMMMTTEDIDALRQAENIHRSTSSTDFDELSSMVDRLRLAEERQRTQMVLRIQRAYRRRLATHDG